MNRSLLFVPAKQKMLDKISLLKADKFIIDLEDSISADDKEFALANLLEFLDLFDDVKNIIVRLNKELYRHELEILNMYDIDFMLPKFESNEDYDIGMYTDRHKFFALVETPLGLVNIKDIASSDEIYAIAFGAEDYTANAGMQNSIEYLIYQKSRLVTYAKAYGKKIFDTPSFKLDNEELFEKEVEDAFNLGFDGKLLISPKHIDYINKIFSAGNIETIKSIIDTYEQSGEAVLVIDGKVYEKMHITHLKKILKEKGE